MEIVISLLVIFLLSIITTFILCDGKIVKQKYNCKSKKLEFKKK